MHMILYQAYQDRRANEWVKKVMKLVSPLQHPLQLNTTIKKNRRANVRDSTTLISIFKWSVHPQLPFFRISLQYHIEKLNQVALSITQNSIWASPSVRYYIVLLRNRRVITHLAVHHLPQHQLSNSKWPLDVPLIHHNINCINCISIPSTVHSLKVLTREQWFARETKPINKNINS